MPESEETGVLALYQFPKTVEDNVDIFLTVARILDSMLKKVDSSNPILVNYLLKINMSVKTGVLLPKTTEGPSMKQRGSKKEAQPSPSKVSPVATVEKSPKKIPVKKAFEEKHQHGSY